MIEVSGLCKSFGKKRVLEDVTFAIKPGERVALLGHNGSGKSTLFNVLAGLLPYETGCVRIGGHRIGETEDRVKRMRGYAADVPPLYDLLTPIEYLRYVATLWQLNPDHVEQDLPSLLRQFHLWGARHEWMQNLSKGMRQKVGLIAVLMRNPPLLLLDEPFTGLDKHSVQTLIGILQQLPADVTVLLSSHEHDLVTMVTTRAIVLENGKMQQESEASASIATDIS